MLKLKLKESIYGKHTSEPLTVFGMADFPFTGLARLCIWKAGRQELLTRYLGL